MENEKNELSIPDQGQPAMELTTAPVGAIAMADALEAAEKRMEYVKKMLSLSLKVTSDQDWINQDDKPYLQASGVEKVARLFGVKFKILSTSLQDFEDDLGKYYQYVVHARASMGNIDNPSDSVEAIGTCSTRDNFFGKKNKQYKPVSEIDRNNILKKATTNARGRAIKELLGMNNLTWDQVRTGGVDKSKMQSVTHDKGKQSPPKDQSSAPKEKPSKDTLDEIKGILLEKCLGDEDAAKDALQGLTSFQKKDGGTYKGVRSTSYLSKKQADIVLRKLKEEQKPVQQELAPKEQEDEGQFPF